MTAVLIAFWSLVVATSWQLVRVSSRHPRYFFARVANRFDPYAGTSARLLERLGRIKFSEPGWVLSHLANQDQIRATLEIVGKPISVRSFLGLKQLVLTFFVVYFWLYLWFGDVSWKNTGWFVVLLTLSFHLPDLWLQAQKERRLRLIAEEVPYFIDLLSLTLQTGMNIEQALIHTADHKKGFVAATIRKKCESLKLGRPIETLLQELKTLIPNPEFDHFLTHILRAKKLGVSLTDTLEIQSGIMRTKRRQMAEELSRTAAVKISLPLVLFIFPALLIIYIGPGLLHLMHN